MGRAQARGADARDALEHPEDLGERVVLATQDVLLPGPAERRGQEMPARDIGHVDQIEPGIERGEHAPEEIVEDHLARRGGLDVPWPEGSARIDDHDGQAAGGVLLGHTLGEELRALVGPDHVVEAHGRGLGPGPTLRGQPKRAHARGVDDALHPGARAGLEHGARALDVGAVDLRRIAGPEPVVAGHVEDSRAARDRRGHGVGLEDVAAHHLDRATLERLETAGRTSEDPDTIAVREEKARHIGSHEAGGAGDQHIHVRCHSRAQLTPAGAGCYHVDESRGERPRSVHGHEAARHPYRRR